MPMVLNRVTGIQWALDRQNSTVLDKRTIVTIMAGDK